MKQLEIPNAPSAKVIALGRARPREFAEAYGYTSKNMITDEILGYYLLAGNSLRGPAVVELSRGMFMGRWRYGVTVAVETKPYNGRWTRVEADLTRADGKPVSRVLDSEQDARNYIEELTK